MVNGEESFLQSYEWENLQEKLGRKTWRIDKDGLSALVIKQSLPFSVNYLYVPRIHLKNISELQYLIRECKKIAEAEKSIFLKIEPENGGVRERDLISLGLSIVEPSQPDTTSVINLLKDSESILAQMESSAKYAIKTAEKRGVEIVSDDMDREEKFEKFWEIFLETNQKHSLSAYPKKYYEILSQFNSSLRTEILLAKLKNEYIAGAMILNFGGTATYLYAASKSGYGRYNAPSLIIWKAILSAKNRGHKSFDFWGISDANKRWKKFTSFKKSFGGSERKYSGTWNLPIRKFAYIAYKLAKLIRI